MSKKLAWIYPDQAKSRKAIGVPLGSVAITVLRRRLGQNPKYVFTYDGHPVTDVTTKAWYKALSRADIHPGFRWHDLRHTWASWHAHFQRNICRASWRMWPLSRFGTVTQICHTEKIRRMGIRLTYCFIWFWREESNQRPTDYKSQSRAFMAFYLPPCILTYQSLSHMLPLPIFTDLPETR